MPNPELSQYHDHDTNTLYDLKDDTARADISTLQTDVSNYSHKITITLVMNSASFSQDDRKVYFDIDLCSNVSNGLFDPEYSGILICCIFYPWDVPTTFDADKNVYFTFKRSGIQRYCPVYKDASRNNIAKWGDFDGYVINVAYWHRGTSTFDFYFVDCPGTIAASNVSYDNTISGLSASNVKTALDELASEKADASALAPVATSGDYDDLLNKPTIPAAQVQADWNEADNTAADYIKNKPTIPDISTKMDKSNPTGSGALSINRLDNTTVGDQSVAVGLSGTASGLASFSEGYITTASGSSSHAEGTETIASGNHSHAEGEQTEANGDWSHAEGRETIADSDYQHVGGKYNIVDNADTYVEIIGNGTNSNARSNARTLDWNGNETIAGDFFFNGNNAALSSQLSDKADASSLATVATSGDYDDLLNKPTIPAAQVQSDWTQSNSGAVDYIKNKPSLATVATSGDYNDLINKLSAGANISISASNEISATDTKPSDFDAATFSVTANNNTTTSFKSKTLSKGIYIFVGCAQFASNANGIRSISFSINGSTSDNYAFVMNAVSGAKTYTQIIMVFNLTQTSNTVVFQGYQNSGSNLAVTGVFETIKIL